MTIGQILRLIGAAMITVGITMLLFSLFNVFVIGGIIASFVAIGFAYINGLFDF